MPDGAYQCPGCKLFLPGNRAAEQHGSHSERSLALAVVEAANEIEDVLGDGPGSERRYVLARSSAARALARARLLEDFLDERGLLDSKGRPRPATKLLAEANGSLLRHLESLGMTPASAARLGLDLERARRLTMAEEMAAQRSGGSRSPAKVRSEGDGP